MKIPTAASRLRRQLIKDINSMGWGEVKSIDPGRHKRSAIWSRVRNNLLHVKMSKVKLASIPSLFCLCGHEVYVTKPGEKIKQNCSFCRKPWHLEETCWKKSNNLNLIAVKRISYRGD